MHATSMGRPGRRLRLNSSGANLGRSMGNTTCTPTPLAGCSLFYFIFVFFLCASYICTCTSYTIYIHFYEFYSINPSSYVFCNISRIRGPTNPLIVFAILESRRLSSDRLGFDASGVLPISGIRSPAPRDIYLFVLVFIFLVQFLYRAFPRVKWWDGPGLYKTGIGLWEWSEGTQNMDGNSLALLRSLYLRTAAL